MEQADHLALRTTMRDIYRACSEGAEKPHAVLTNGSVLNQMLGADEYDEATAYIVTREGIKPME